MTTKPNPYAAPTDEQSPVRAPRSALRHRRLKHYYLACILAPLPLTALSREAPAFAMLSLVAAVLSVVMFCMWLQRSWALLPSRSARGTTPSAAVGYNFVPGWNLIWQFVANQRLVAGLAASLAKYPTRVRPPTILAVVGPGLSSLAAFLIVTSILTAGSGGAPSGVTMLLPFVMLTPFAWFAWMVRVDGCFEEVAFQRAEKKQRKAAKTLREADS